MSRTARTVAATAVAVALGPATPALAAPTESAVLDCGSSSYTVNGFGRGQVLHVEASKSKFVVTRAVLEDGTVAFDSPSAADRPLVTCATVTPDDKAYTFTGFFT